ncbi:MAG: hypothetical protein ABF969_04320 [Sporolactobacillus sp.]
MCNNFRQTKSVYGYLVKRYGKLHFQSIQKENEIERRLIEEHSFYELKQMLNRLEGSIHVNEIIPTITGQLFSLLNSFVTIFFSIVISMIAVIVSLAGTLLEGKIKFTAAKAISSLNGLSPIFTTSVTWLAILMVILIIGWYGNSAFIKREMIKCKMAMILVSEAIEKYPDWKK